MPMYLLHIGLNEIIPDNLGLLSTFNEHELEVMSVGTPNLECQLAA